MYTSLSLDIDSVFEDAEQLRDLLSKSFCGLNSEECTE